MPVLLRWYLVVQLLGLLAFLAARPALRRLPDGGWGIAKTLGVVLAGMGCWLGTAFGLLRNDLGGASLAVLVLAAAAAARTRRRELRALGRLRGRWLPMVIALEACFLLAFAGWAALRAGIPGVHHTEQPMDLLFLSAVSLHPEYPPPDPWLSGHPIAYYYLGYWLVATLSHLTATAPEVAYNVGLATWGALLVAACFGLGYSLAAAARPGRGGVPLAAGGISALAVAGAGNLHHAAEWLQSMTRGSAPGREGWWWWRASRTVQDVDPGGRPIEVITEFPFFSYLLGDLHPHVLSMPVLAAAATVSLALLRDAASKRPERAASGVLRRHFPLAAIVCAALLAMNTWDFPTGWLLIAAAAFLALPGDGRSRLRPAALFAGLVLVSAFALATPHLLTTGGQVRGFLPNLLHPTPLPAMARAAGVFVLPVGLLLALAWRWHPVRASRVARRVLMLAAGSLLVLALGALWSALAPAGRAWAAGLSLAEGLTATALARWARGLPALSILILALAACAAWLESARRSAAARLAPAVLLAAVGLLLLVGPELLFVHDVFANRMNTVFKLHYQAWLLLAVAGGTAVAVAWCEAGRLRLVAAMATGVLCLGLLYSVEALRDRASRPRTLDGLAELQHLAPGELSAVRWLRRHSRPSDVVVHAFGDSYRADQALPSAATSRPTLLGWRGHEIQWRGKRYGELAAGREEAVEALMRPGSPARLHATLDRWGVTWLWVGPRERELYGVTGDDERLLAAEMELAWSAGEVRLYRRRG